MSDSAKDVYDKNSIENWDANTYFSPKTSAVYTVGGYAHSDKEPKSDASTYDLNQYKSKPCVFWGLDNLQPLHTLKLNAENHFAFPLMELLTIFIIGKGVRPAIKQDDLSLLPVKSERFPRFKAWARENPVHEIIENCALDLLSFGRYHVQMARHGRGKNATIGKAAHQDVTTCRAGYMKDGIIPQYFICPDWIKPILEGDNKNITEIKSFAYAKALPENKAKLDMSCDRLLFDGRKYFPAHPYYPPPYSKGGDKWKELSNRIPLFHLDGIKKGYKNVRVWVKIPESWVNKKPAEKRESETKAMIKLIDSWLDGEGVGKVFTSFKSNSGLEFENWEIEQFPFDIPDTAFTTLFDQSNMVASAAHGIHPALANIILPNAMSNATELVAAYNIFMKTGTPKIRRILLQWLYAVKHYNGWEDELDFVFEDISLADAIEAAQTQNGITAREKGQPQQKITDTGVKSK